ncbi:leucine dehydrogenase [Anaerolineae bacterium]|nr:leucine dehydrogenase [Anaerolineae bacterium]
MEQLKKWNGENVIVRFDHPTGAWILIAIHSTRLGPAGGGTRMKTYPSFDAALDDVLRLAEGMTRKFAVVDFPFGGGKTVIALPPNFDPRARADLLRRYGALVYQLGGLFYTGPDVGTSSADMDVIAETGAPYVFGRTPQAGGAGDSGPITALGVLAGIQVTCAHLFGSDALPGRRILVQGAGSVGGTLINHLCDAGATVLFSDVDQHAITHFRDERGIEFVPAESVYDTECDIFAPCALGGVLNRDTIARLRCRAVAGGANNQLAESDDAERLRARGIVYAPDYVINIGGAMGITGIETRGWSRAEAESRVTETVRRALRQVFELAQAEDVTTEAAARRIAEERLANA